MSQASAELRSEDTDTKSPGKSSTMLTRHAKVRGRKTADLGPKYARGLAVSQAAPPPGDRVTFVCQSSTLPRAAWPRPSVLSPLEGGVGAGPSEVDVSRPNRTVTAAARRWCSCQAGVRRGSSSLATLGEASRPVPAALPWERPCPPTLSLQPPGVGRPLRVELCQLAVHVARCDHLRVVAHAHYLIRVESGEIPLLSCFLLSLAAMLRLMRSLAHQQFGYREIVFIPQGQGKRQTLALYLSTKCFVKCYICNVLKQRAVAVHPPKLLSGSGGSLRTRGCHWLGLTAVTGPGR